MYLIPFMTQEPGGILFPLVLILFSPALKNKKIKKLKKSLNLNALAERTDINKQLNLE